MTQSRLNGSIFTHLKFTIMAYNPEGNCFTKQNELSREPRTSKPSKWRTRLVAVVLPMGIGAPAVVTNYDSAPVMAYIGRSETPPTTTPPTTIFEAKNTTTTRPKPKETTTTTSAKPTATSGSCSTYDQIYRAAGQRFGQSPIILSALHEVESHCAGSGKLANAEGSGAQGPMQFMPGTWASNGVDGNGDGKANIDDVTDAIFGAANLLSKYPTINEALTAYGTNKSRVIAIARPRDYTG